MNTKKTAFGIIGGAAATLLTVGLAAPALADPGHGDTTSTTTSSRAYAGHIARDVMLSNLLNGGNSSTTAPIVVSPDLNVGDVASGNAVGSGDNVTAPLLSGNDTAVGSGNSTWVGNGTSIGTSVSNLVSGSTGGIGTDVNGMVGDITGALGLSGR